MVDAGATLAASPAELAAKAEAVITILTDAAAIEAVYNGPSGLLSGDVRGKLFIEMSTVPPAVPVALAEKVRAKGAAMVECPVGGSTGPARQGKLLGLMGAAPEDAARAKPILDQLCRRVEHAGPVGSGAVLKFTVNMPLMIYWQALGEALALCRSLDLDPERLMDMLSETSGAATVLKVRGPGIAKMLKGGDGGPVTFNIDGAIKDLRAMLAEGKAQGIELPLVEKTLGLLRGGAAQGHGRRRNLRRLGLLGEPRASGLTSGPLHDRTCPEFIDVRRHARASFHHRRCRAQERPRDQFPPLTVAVLDAGGHLVAFKREDKSGILRFDIAYGKAWGALGMGFGSRTLAERAASTPQFFTMLAAASGGRIVSNPGGVLIRDAAAT